MLNVYRAPVVSGLNTRLEYEIRGALTRFREFNPGYHISTPRTLRQWPGRGSQICGRQGSPLTPGRRLSDWWRFA